MTQAQFDALIGYINAKVAYSEGRCDMERVVRAMQHAESTCVTENDHDPH